MSAANGLPRRRLSPAAFCPASGRRSLLSALPSCPPDTTALFPRLNTRGRSSRMPGNLSFPSRWLAPFWVVTLCFALQGQTYKVEAGKTITITVPGVTAAYSLDAACADAAAENGVVTVAGKFHGTTHVMAVTASGAQPLEIIVTDPPVKLPPGFRESFTSASGVENGYVDSRYDSTAGRVQSQIDLSRRQGDFTIHAHAVETRLLGALSPGNSRMALSSAFYRISTPDRDITILDQNLIESPLGITGSIVRGLHYRQGGWFLHDRPGY